MYRIFFLFALLSTSARGQRVGETCLDNYSNTFGQCKPFNDCVSAKRDIKRRRITPTFCSYNAFGERIVCCRDGSNHLNSPGTQDDRPIWGNTDNTNDRRRISERKCDEYSKAVVKTVPYSPLIPDPDVFAVTEEKCEYSGLELIIGGEDTKLGEFPHMAAVGWEQYGGGYLFRCGGSLISPRFVVTAAHCQDPLSPTPQPVVVRLGDQNIDDNVYDRATPIDVAIRRMHVHPDYNSPSKYNDIALLELETDVKFSSSIRPACLWTSHEFGGHENVIATGWGVNDTRTGETSKELQKVSLPILNVRSCNRTLKSVISRNWMYGFIDSQMCAGQKRARQDTCSGDSGGPIQVVSQNNNCIFHIVGITSFGKKCAEGRPAVYTRVSSYVDWIESVVWPGQ